MDSDAWTLAQSVHERYEDTSLAVFRQIQQLQLQRDNTSAAASRSLKPWSDSGASEHSVGHRLTTLFRRGSQSKTTQSSVCVLL